MTSYVFEMVLQDLQPTFRAILKADGEPINLTGWTSIVLVLKHLTAGTTYVFALTITSAVDGEVSRTWIAADFLTPFLTFPGEYLLRIRGTTPAAQEVTFPTGPPERAFFHPRLG